MKIALVSPYDHVYSGGVGEHVRGLAGALRERGHHVTILAPSSLVGDDHDIPGYVRMGPTVPVRGNRSIAHVGLSPRLGRRVLEILAGNAFDVIHCQEPLLPTLPLFVLRANRGADVGTFHASGRRNLGYQWCAPLLAPYFRRLHSCIAVSMPARDYVVRYFPADYRVIPNGVDTRRFTRGHQP